MGEEHAAEHLEGEAGFFHGGCDGAGLEVAAVVDCLAGDVDEGVVGCGVAFDGDLSVGET